MHRTAWGRKLREVASELGRITFTNHARSRDPKAGKMPIDIRTAQACLREGVVIEGPSRDIKLIDGWKGKVSRNADGMVTEVACVLVLDEEDGDWILVITGYRCVPARRSGRKRPDRNA